MTALSGISWSQCLDFAQNMTPGTHAAFSTTSPFPSYYSTINFAPEIGPKFHNIDSEVAFKACQAELENAGSRSLLLDFDTDEAWCAFNLQASVVDALLKAPRPSSLATRWINFWGADLQDQKEGIRVISSHYGLSARLTSLLCSDAYRPPTPKKQDPSAAADTKNALHVSEEVANGDIGDLESGGPTAIRIAEQAFHTMDIRNVSFGQIVNEIWHFCSVDWGDRYLCLGYNSLFSVPEGRLDNGPYKPEGKRIWTRLILCDDGTIVSIYENPFPGNIQDDAEVLKIVRRNALNVFHHLSKLCKSDEHRNSPMTTQIRNFDHSIQPDNGKDSASLMLYYLFDDWITTYGLVAKREHPYGAELDRIRGRMVERASLGLVDSLHLIGRRLAVLKRIYQSYELMINRILQRQKLMKGKLNRKAQKTIHKPLLAVSQENDLIECNESGHFRNSYTTGQPTGEEMPLGVQLSAAAIMRFERLLDRIGLYALNEIDECLAEKESLVFMVCTSWSIQFIADVDRTST